MPLILQFKYNSNTILSTGPLLGNEIQTKPLNYLSEGTQPNSLATQSPTDFSSLPDGLSEHIPTTTLRPFATPPLVKPTPDKRFPVPEGHGKQPSASVGQLESTVTRSSTVRSNNVSPSVSDTTCSSGELKIAENGPCVESEAVTPTNNALPVTISSIASPLSSLSPPSPSPPLLAKEQSTTTDSLTGVAATPLSRGGGSGRNIQSSLRKGKGNSILLQVYVTSAQKEILH